MVNYKNGKIYGIYHGTQLVYIGSTCSSLIKRWSNHKHYGKTGKGAGAMYEAMKTNGVDQYHIELIKNCPCNSKEELLQAEGETIRDELSGGNLNLFNKVTPGGYILPKNHTNKKEYDKEYRELNIEKKREADRKYALEHAEEAKQRANEWYKNNKEQARKTQKAYYETNKVQLLTQCKTYREQNKEHINMVQKIRREKNSEDIQCGCGSIYKKYKLNDHFKTKKHIKWMQSTGQPVSADMIEKMERVLKQKEAHRKRLILQ